MVNYQYGKIYSLRTHNDNNLVYIGSTTKTYLSQRLGEHKSNYKKYLNGKYHWVTSFIILEKGDYYIELIEHFPCQSKDELHKREGELIRLNECINNNVAGRSNDNDYKEKMKEYHKEYNKKYRQENNEKIKEYSQDYYKNNRERINQNIQCKICNRKYTFTNKSRHLKSTKHLQALNNSYCLHILFD